MKKLHSAQILIYAVGINSIVFLKNNYDKAYVREIAFFARKIKILHTHFERYCSTGTLSEKFFSCSRFQRFS